MGFRGLVIGVIVVGIAALGGCATGVPDPAGTAVESGSPSATPVDSQPSAVIVSVDDIAVVDAGGVSLSSAPFTQAEAVIDFVTGLEGSAPEVDDSLLSHKGLVTYTWPGVRCIVSGSEALLVVEVDEIGGLPLRTSDGIQVGSSRSDVLGLSPVDTGSDQDGDGTSDVFGLEARPAPGTESLVNPGQEGVDYIEVSLSGDAVVNIRAPFGDYRDL